MRIAALLLLCSARICIAQADYSTLLLLGPAAAGGGGGSPQSFSDDFNRADSSNLGANWTEINGDLAIAGNILYNVTAANTMCGAVWNTACNSVTQYGKFTVTDFNQGFTTWFIFRYVDASSPFYILEQNNVSDTWTWSYVASATFGTVASIESVSQTLASGNSTGFTVEGTGTGTTVRIWLNPTGAAPTSTTVWGGAGPTATFSNDPATAADTGTKVGVGMMSNITHAQDLDNWSAGDVP